MAITRTASLYGKKFCQPPGRPPCPCVQYMTFIIPCSPFSFCVFRSSAFAFQPPPGPRLRLRFLSILACISLSSPLPFLPPGHTLHVRCLWCPWVLALAPLSFLLLDLLRVLVFYSLRRSSFGLVFHHSCFWGSPPSPFSSLLQFLPFVSVLALSHPRSRLVLRFLFSPLVLPPTSVVFAPRGSSSRARFCSLLLDPPSISFFPLYLLGFRVVFVCFSLPGCPFRLVVFPPLWGLPFPSVKLGFHPESTLGFRFLSAHWAFTSFVLLFLSGFSLASPFSSPSWSPPFCLHFSIVPHGLAFIPVFPSAFAAILCSNPKTERRPWRAPLP